MTLERRLQLVGCDQDALWVSTALKVAFATTDMKHVDQHFGAARSFALYALDKNKYCFMEACEFGHLFMDGNEDKLSEKIAALEGCAAVYSQAIGASAVRQLKSKNIQAVKVTPGVEIVSLLHALQEELIHGPDGWLAKAIKRTLPADPARFDVMADEGWEE